MVRDFEKKFYMMPKPICGVWAWGSSLSEYGVEKALRDMKEIGITDLFLLVKGTTGKVCWPSKIALAFSQDTTVLPRSREGCEKNNIRLHAWFIVSQDKSYLQRNPGSGMWGIPLELETHEYRLGEHSCFRISTAAVDFVADVNYREYILSLVSEVLGTYEPSGIHLDYIRYPNGAWGWGPVQQQRAMMAGLNVNLLVAKAVGTWGNQGDNISFIDAFIAGDPNVVAWSNMRKDDVTDFARQIGHTVKNKRPSTILSAALIPEGGDIDLKERIFALVQFGQNYSDLSEICDVVVPMAYHHDFRKPISWVSDVLLGTQQAVSERSSVIVGIQAHGDVPAAEVIEAIRVSKLSKADGVCLFAFHEIFRKSEMQELLQRAMKTV